MNVFQLQILAPLVCVVGMYFPCSVRCFCVCLFVFLISFPKLPRSIFRLLVFLLLGLFRGLFIHPVVENYSYKYTSFKAKIHNIQVKEDKVFLTLKDFEYVDNYCSKLLIKTDSRALFPKEAKMELAVEGLKDLSNVDEIIAIGRFYFPAPRLYKDAKTLPKGIIKEMEVISYKRASVKDSLRAKLYRTLPQNVAAICSAIFFGDIFSVDLQSRDLFSKTGVSYLLGPSILNLALILYVLDWLFYQCLVYLFIRLSQYVPLKILSKILSFLAILAYFLMLGEDFPLLREFVMYNLFLIVSLYRKKNQLELLFYTAMITLGIFPEGIHSISFQLTFGGVLGIFAFQRYYKNWVVSSLKMTASALSFVMPVSIYHFHSIVLQPYLSTLIMMPIFTFLLIPLILVHLLLPEIFCCFTGFLIENLFGVIFFVLNVLRDFAFFVHVRPISKMFLLLFVIFYIFFAVIREKIRYVFLSLAYFLFGVGIYRGYYFKPFILTNIYNTILVLPDKIIVYPKMGNMARYLVDAYNLPCCDGRDSGYFIKQDGVLIVNNKVKIVSSDEAVIDYCDDSTYIFTFDELKRGVLIVL